MEVDESGFYNRLLDYNNILFLCHRNADPDAVGSAYTLAQSLGGAVGIVDGCNRVANTLIKTLEIEAIEMPNPLDYDLTVVVDTSTLAQLNGIELAEYAVIDHHSTCAIKDGAEFYLHRTASSTAEIVFDILKFMEAPVMRKSAMALIAGIITDTGNFKYANPDSFRTLAEIIEVSGVEYGEVVDLLASTPQDISMRIALLKAAIRAQVHRTGNWLIVTSTISSFGGTAAGILTHVGADVSFVGAEKDGIVRISGRARRNAIDAGVNLGQILDEVSKQFHGKGGGHDGAAGLDVEGGDVQEILKSCVDVTISKLQ
ncbi:MAG: DHHA1 domain-containing protein [ANME-2 cluster archaeon]|jgi:nanoRNase/pAp phosphatase (c-di-AMP/oligoRNAs hydrolase)|nr:DHHA1 domain-containing protein [ANME-2 cluster archaeon]